MNSRQLQYFVAIIEEGGIIKASRALHIAQPALSKHILNLEEELGVKLLTRTASGITPTHFGKTLYLHAKKIAAQFKQAKHDVITEANTPAGEVFIILPPMLSGHIAPRLVKEIERSYPDIQLKIIEARSLKAQNLIDSGRVDLGLLACESTNNRVAGMPLYREYLYLVENMEETNDGGQVKEISFQELTKKALVSSYKHHALRRLLEDTAAEKNLQLNIKIEAESGHLMRCYVQDAVAAAVLPWCSLAYMWQPSEVLVSRIVKPKLERTVYIAWPKNLSPNAACNVVKDMIIKLTLDLYQQGVIRGQWLDNSNETSV